jgi:hypothetical protein
VKYTDPSGYWTKTENGWKTDDEDDIYRFMDMINIETFQNQNVSMEQINTFVFDEFMGTGGQLSDCSVLLSGITATKNDQGMWNVPEYQLSRTRQEIDYWGKLRQNEDGAERWYQNAGFDGGEHFIGPALYLFGQPINALKPFGALGSESGSSIASYTLSKTFPQRFTKVFGKELGTNIVKKTGTNVIGRFAGRMVPYAGWALTTYDAATWSFEMGQKYGPLTTYLKYQEEKRYKKSELFNY